MMSMNILLVLLAKEECLKEIPLQVLSRELRVTRERRHLMTKEWAWVMSKLVVSGIVQNSQKISFYVCLLWCSSVMFYSVLIKTRLFFWCCQRHGSLKWEFYCKF